MFIPVSRAGLSGAPAGNGIVEITGTDAASANTLHEAVIGTGADDWDELWLVCTNGSTSDRLLTLIIGGVNEGPIRIPSYSTFRVLDGHPLQNGLETKAFADASGLVIKGYVNEARAA
jgi:hypothetical protein